MGPAGQAEPGTGADIGKRPFRSRFPVWLTTGVRRTDPPTPYQHPQWNQATHEWAIKEAGFRDCTWYPSEVAPADIARYGEAYWRDFYDNCLVIGLVCQK